MNAPPFRRVSRLLQFVVRAVLLCLFLISPARAQDEVPTVTRTYALENATVVQAPGQVLDRATVVVRNGLIDAVGADIPIPFDARRIGADSLTVYAGFISGLSSVAVNTPGAKDERREVNDPGNPPNDRAGLQPDRHVRVLLDPADDDLDSLREAGFTTAHVVPTGRMLPGAGAIIQLAGDDPDAMILREDASLFAQFKGARGVYPATSMAVIATWRQLYREAERRQSLQVRYAQNPHGMERPPHDPVHSAFFPVLDGAKPVFFYTTGALETRRALTLKDEFDVPFALAGLREGFRAADALSNVDADLFLSLDLPEEETPSPADTVDADTTVAATPPDSATSFLRDFRTRSYADTDDELDNLKARQAIAREAYYRNAATLHEAGVPFSFMTRDVKVRDIRKNLRTMIAHGLPEDIALAALTTRPAAALGLARQLGTVEAGKIANLVVTDGPYFAEDTHVRYVFVDGRRFEVEEAPGSDEEDDEATTPTSHSDFNR